MEAYYTFSEFPEGLIVFFAGCNYRCPFCNARDLIEFKNECLQDLKLLFDVMKRHLGRKIIISGGEPLLQRQALINILSLAKKLNMHTTLDTNASKPGVLKDIFSRGLVDEIIVGINASEDDFENVMKAGTFFRNSSTIFADFKESLKILKEFNDQVTITFKSVVVPGLIFKKESFLKMAELIKNIDAEWIISPFNPKTTLSRIYQGVEKPSMNFIASIKQTIEKNFPDIRVRIEDSSIIYPHDS